jgi:UDP-N-acetylenolpyruvoylglucosamine reductase
MFKNPDSIPAGKLIDELGLKGVRVGGARVSQEHGNFLVNDGGATAADVLELIGFLQARAKAERGIELHPEVEVIGE